MNFEHQRTHECAGSPETKPFTGKKFGRNRTRTGEVVVEESNSSELCKSPEGVVVFLHLNEQ